MIHDAVVATIDDTVRTEMERGRQPGLDARADRSGRDLKDIATFIDVLRAPHHHSEDTVKAYESLTQCVTIRDRWAALLESIGPRGRSYPRTRQPC